MKNIITIFCFFILIEPVMAVQNSSTEDTVTCDSPESRQFDFWIGDRDIRQKIPGRRKEPPLRRPRCPERIEGCLP